MHTDSLIAPAVQEAPATLRSHCFVTDAPADAAETAACTVGRAPYLTGIVPTPRQALPGYNSAVVLLVLGVFMFVAANFKHYNTFLPNLSQELLGVRKRANVFNDHTVNESRIMLSLIVMVCFAEAVLLLGKMHAAQPSGMAVFALLMAMMAVTCGYYVVQLCAYTVVGRTFTDPVGATQWIRGFNASQAFLGIALIVPALVTLFYPGTAAPLFTLGVGMYVAARIVFICKGFKIFYHKFYSLLYFILYLCALEIAPILALMRLDGVFNSL